MKHDKPTPSLRAEVTSTAEDILDDAQEIVTDAQNLLQTAAAPVRKHIFKRFPTLFLMAVTFGVSITFFGVEQLLSSSWLVGHPWISLLLGISILAATGTLYKKLG